MKETKPKTDESSLQSLINEIETEIGTLKKRLTSTEKREDRIRKLVEDLRTRRKVTDFRFDQVYPSAIRDHSRQHWTPVEVAIRAAELLASDDRTRVLDVGSGCGKFCTVAALSCHGHYVGVEQRPHLLAVAKETSLELGADRTSFVLGNMADLDWSLFDSFYLFNPFYENMLKTIRIDDTVSFHKDKLTRHVEIVRTKLAAAKPGTRVVTYHGFGGDMPIGYQQLKKEPIGTSFLMLWVKVEFPNDVLTKAKGVPTGWY